MIESSQPAVDVSIVVPVYRGEKSLPELIRRIGNALNGVRHEVILVNDCSPDQSWQVIRAIASQNPQIVGLNLRKNAGQHNAIMAGLNYATGKIIVTMDDDLQHAPEDVPKLLGKISDGYDVCYTKFAIKKHALWKRAGSQLNDWLAVLLLGKPPGLYLSPFKAMRREVKDEVVKYSGPSTYIDGLMLSVTSNIASVEVQHHPRADGGEGGYNLRRSISLLLKMSTITSTLPLRLATLLGFAFGLLGAFLAVLLIAQRFIWNAMPIGWSSIIVSSLILGGIQLLALGILGEYIGRIFLEVRKRPQFVIAGTTSEATNEAV
jgi:polyisoprenyl-phosphate glycosyltransferase